jgi:hypothetical protein
MAQSGAKQWRYTISARFLVCGEPELRLNATQKPVTLAVLRCHKINPLGAPLCCLALAALSAFPGKQPRPRSGTKRQSLLAVIRLGGARKHSATHRVANRTFENTPYGGIRWRQLVCRTALLQRREVRSSSTRLRPTRITGLKN